MDIRQLRFLTSLARERHFARAADAVGISQPTLSARIKQLEEELGVAIVERGHRFKGFTAEGERVLRWAQRILADCDALGQELAAARGALGGTIRIGAIPSALPATPQLTVPFHQAHPDVLIDVRSMSSIEIQRGLESFDLHAGITYLDNEPLQHVLAKKLFDERYVLVRKAGNGASNDAASQAVTWLQAADMPLCLLSHEMQNRRIIDAVFARVGAIAKPIVETNSISALYAHLLNSDLATILPDNHLALLPRGTLEMAPLIEPAASQPVGLVVLNNEPMPALVRALWQIQGDN